MEFESSDRKPAPPSQVCIVYDPRDGRIVHGHIFVGKGPGLFGPEGRDERERETLEGARRNHGDVTKLKTLHVPTDFRFVPNVAYRVDSKGGRLVERAIALRDARPPKRRAARKRSTSSKKRSTRAR